MKTVIVAVAAAAAVVTLAIVSGFLWDVFGPSAIHLRNVGDRRVSLVLTDGDRSTRVWSGDLAPDRQKTVFVWFKHEGGPELRRRDQVSSQAARLGYVTGHMPIRGEIKIDGCDSIQPHLR